MDVFERGEMEKLRVLAIEDNPADARLLKEALKPYMENQFDLVHELTLEQGLRRVSTDEIGLILLDLFLPGSSGLETLERVKEVAPRTPVIVFTGVYADWLAVHSLRLGACCFFNKEWLDAKNLVRAFRYYAGFPSTA